MLRRLYPVEYGLNQHGQLLSSMGFAGIGMSPLWLLDARADLYARQSSECSRLDTSLTASAASLA